MDVRLSLASIRISQGLSDDARKVIDGVYGEVVAASSEGTSLLGPHLFRFDPNAFIPLRRGMMASPQAP
jgi:hypothetical protein